ncbi:amino acid ABC transporter permease [Nocardiopsis chromatogenes]|uniref:amino acid ABC transporter permease n=1 Tax=Nocardiopsis chromatogenes TaxID=280239 RepID=UPI00034D53C8|nr:amino acid ABC transporter permease [Nocardiopsis chromatogenes]
MDFVINSLPLYWEGALLTIRLTVFGAALAFVLAVVVGTLGTMRNKAARAVAMVYTEVFRGVAALVLLFWFGNSLQEITGFRLETEFAAILALGLNVGAYGAEVVRSSINAVPRAQTEASIALNMTWWRRTRLVVFPQAWAQMLPTFGNLVIELMKATAIVSLIGLTDLTKVADDFRASAVADTFTVYSVALVGYFLFAQVLIVLVRLLERRANRKLGRPTDDSLLGLLRPPSIGTTTGGAR